MDRWNPRLDMPDVVGVGIGEGQPVPSVAREAGHGRSAARKGDQSWRRDFFIQSQATERPGGAGIPQAPYPLTFPTACTSTLTAFSTRRRRRWGR